MKLPPSILIVLACAVAASPAAAADPIVYAGTGSDHSGYACFGVEDTAPFVDPHSDACREADLEGDPAAPMGASSDRSYRHDIVVGLKYGGVDECVYAGTGGAGTCSFNAICRTIAEFCKPIDPEPVAKIDPDEPPVDGVTLASAPGR